MKKQLFCIQLDEDENFHTYHHLLKLLSSEKQQSITRFRFVRDKKLSLFSDLAVRYLACSILGVNNSRLVFSKEEFGKPYLAGFPGFHYNISHTGNAVAVGIHEKPIGVDIEKIKPFDIGIAKRFFCKKEQEYILSRSEKQAELFYEVWTKKEAFVKWIGKGLAMPFTDFDVTDAKTDKMLYTTKINNYIISVCFEGGADGIETIKTEEKECGKWIHCLEAENK